MSLLVVGSVALDTVFTPKGSFVEGLGGSATYFSVAASIFTPVKLVGIIGNDFPSEHIDRLTDRQIGVEGLYTAEGKTFRWSGRYGDDFGDPETLDTQLNVFADFSPKLPEKYKNAPFLFLGNIHPRLQLQVLDQLKSPKFTAVDTMNFWIERERESLLEVFKRIDMAVINELEVRLLTGIRSPLAGARKVQAMGPKILVVKRGAYGSMTLIDDEIFLFPAFPTDDVTDPTGAGDSFAGGMLGYIAGRGEISNDTIKNAVANGTVVGSFCVEGFSINKLEKISYDDISARLEKLRKMMKF